MTCKDCLHFDVCYIVEHYGADTNEECAEHNCKQFKDRSRYVVREKGEWRFKWDSEKDPKRLFVRVVCSECNLHTGQKSNFCPNCGADMTGGDRNV